MAVGHGQVIVTTSATLVVAPDHDGQQVFIKIIGTNDCYVGNGDVSTENGFELEAGEAALSMFLGPGEPLYGIVEQDDAVVCYLATMNQ